MFPRRTLLSLLFVALSVVGATPLDRRTSKATLGFTKQINKLADGQTIADHDRAHAQAMQGGGLLGKRQGKSVGITNQDIHYMATINVGSPPTSYDLLIDTGSSNTWVGAQKAYVPTSTSTDTKNPVHVAYGSGGFSGEEWIDRVALTSELVIEKQSIGAASSSSGLNVDGILGVGPVDLTVGTVKNTGSVPTVTNNLYSQGTIPADALGIYFTPSSVGTTGELTFGGADGSVTTSFVEYVPLTTTSPASNYWGINQTVYYGVESILCETAGIVDTGTTLTLLATDAFQKYANATGGVMDANTGLLKITREQYDALFPLTFIVGDMAYELVPNAQIWPRSLNTDIGGDANSIYLIVADLGTPSGQGLDFINGYTFLERFYSVYDTSNARLGFAETEYTFSECN